MSDLDQRLIARRDQLRAELARTEQAGPSIEEQLAASLRAFDYSVAQHQERPFFPADTRQMPTWERIAGVLQGMAGALNPKARAMHEAAERARLSAFTGSLRLSASDKEARLAMLKRDLASAEAALELARRKIESANDETLDRVGSDAAVWLLMGDELAELAGKDVP